MCRDAMSAEIWRDTKAACSHFTALDAPTRPALHVTPGCCASLWDCRAPNGQHWMDLQLLEVPEVGRSCPMPQPHSLCDTAFQSAKSVYFLEIGFPAGRPAIAKVFIGSQ